jgi:hypothetical protein
MRRLPTGNQEADVSTDEASNLRGQGGHRASWAAPAARIADLLCVMLVVTAAVVAATGGYRQRFDETVISLTSWWRPLLAAAVVAGLRLVLVPRPTPTENLDAAARSVAAAWVPLLLAVPLALYVWVPVHWHRASLDPVSGDEPHYLIVADALARDHSLNVFPSYARDREERRIVGPIDWRNHSRGENDRWYSLHGVGLPLLVAPVFSVAGVFGVRLLLAVLAGAVPFFVYACARLAGLGRPDSVGIALAVSLGLPFAAAAGQIYPDLLTGILVLGLVALCWTALERPVSRGLWLAAAVVLALLPWLHVKNALVAGVLAVALVLARRRGRPDGFQWWPWLVGLQAASAALIITYHLSAFGHLLGPYQAGRTTDATLYQAGMVFLGLHFDQAQGVFVQQPLFLLGLVGLPVFFRRVPFVAVTAGAAYLSVVGLNAFHPAWYGGFSMSGRFMWCGAALWALPLACLYSALGASARRVLAALVLPAFAWQWLLSGQWFRNPGAFFSLWTEYHRNSLFVGAWTGVLPSFYDFDQYLTRLPNVAAVAVALGLLGLGAWLARRRSN